MAGTEAVVIKLSDLVDGQEAVCFAALVQEDEGHDQVQPALHEVRVPRQAGQGGGAPLVGPSASSRRRIRGRKGRPIASGSAASSTSGTGCRSDLLGIRPATDDDAADGFDFVDLCRERPIPADDLLRKLHDLIERYIDHPPLRRLVEDVLGRAYSPCSRRCRPRRHPPHLHLRPARARLEHDADRLLPRRPLRQILRPARILRSTGAS